MRGKSLNKTFALLLIASITLSFAAVAVTFAQTARIFVNPPSGTADPGDYFHVDIEVEGVADLNMWTFNIKYNLDVLSLDELDVTEGSFLSDEGATNFNVKVYGAFGYAIVACSLTGPAGASGSGVLASLDFMVLGNPPGYCDLDLYDTALYDIDLVPIDHTVEDGYFYVETPVPLFEFTPSNPLPSETVLFNASESFSPIGKEIVNYIWDFGDGSPTKATYGFTLITHVYDEYREDPYMVTLTVVDIDGREGSASKPLKIWRDVVTNDIWLDPSWNIDEAVTEVQSGVDCLVLVTASNMGTVPETFDVNLECTGGELEFWWANPVTLGAGKGSGFDLMGAWYQNGVAPGVVTFTMTLSEVPGEIAVDNNVLTFDLTVKPVLLSVEPSEVEEYTPAVDKEFTIDIALLTSAIPDEAVYGFELKLSWDPALIECVESEVIPPWEASYTAKDEISEGSYWAAATALPPAEAFTGSATVVKLTFRIKYDPPYPEDETCVLHLSGTGLINSEGTTIGHEVEDGVYSIDSSLAIYKPGDVNQDGEVNLDDLFIVAQAFGSNPQSANWDPRADVNGNRIVNIQDLVLVAKDYGDP